MRNLIGRVAAKVGTRRAQLAVGVSTLVGTALAPVAANAVPTYDLTPVTTGVSDQVQSALSLGLPFAGGFIALSIAFVWLRKMLKAK